MKLIAWIATALLAATALPANAAPPAKHEAAKATGLTAVQKAQIDKTVIRAPFEGIVGLRQVSPGAYATPATVIATVQQLDKIKVDFTVPEQYSSNIKKGSLVDVQIDASSNIRRKGLIVATEPQINVSSRNLKVRAILQDGQGHPGAFVKVLVNAGTD